MRVTVPGTGDIMVTKIAKFFYFHEMDSLGEETDRKSTMYTSCNENPGRCFRREVLIALRILSSRAILVRASWKAPKEVRCLPVWLDHDR